MKDWFGTLVSTIGFSLIALSVQTADAHISNFGQVGPGIYRGAAPKEIEDFEYLKSIGVKTVINLRKYVWFEERKESRRANQFGFRYEHIPISTLSYPNEQQVNRALALINDPDAQPLYIHCKKGRDRTGMVVALYRVFHDGWSPDQAYDEMKHVYHFGWQNIFMLKFFWDHARQDQTVIESDGLEDDEEMGRTPVRLIPAY